MARTIHGLEWVHLVEGVPPWLRKTRPRGAKALGLRYERALAKALPEARHGQWLHYRDKRGEAWAQPDLILDTSEALVVIEVKYTWVLEGHEQVEMLYKPLLTKLYGKSVVGLVACKVLVPGMPGSFQVTGDFDRAMGLAKAGRPVVFHWQGKGRIDRPGTRHAGAGAPRASSLDRASPLALGL